MPIVFDRFDPSEVHWCHVSDPCFREYKLDYEYSLLGYGLESRRLDMLLRFRGNGGHCMRHRHVASTSTLILRGEQHLEEYRADGSTRRIVRRAGDYAFSGPDALPHMERGGPEGCTLFLSLHAPDGILFEYMDRDLTNRTCVTVEEYVERWRAGGGVDRGT